MQAREIGPNQVVFYWREGFQGQADSYSVGDSKVFTPVNPENDQYKSLSVGSTARVHGWQHYNGTGKYMEWGPGQHNLIDAQIAGLSKFQVLPSTTSFALEVRLVDNTGSPAGAYEMTIRAADVGDVTTVSGDPTYRLVGTSSTSNDITTHIAVRQTAWPGGYVANGSAYFKWNRELGIVEVTTTETFPANMSINRDGNDPTRFTLTLNSVAT